MIDMEAFRDLEAIVGSEYVTQDPLVCHSYAIQPFHRTEPGVWINVPAAVIMPNSTEEVAAIIKVCNKYGIKFKAHSTGFGAHSGPGDDGVIQIDLRRMNHLVEFDEKNMYAVVEPYTTYSEIQSRGWPVGLNLLLNTAGPHTSILASITSHQGGGGSSCSMGYNGRNLLGFEWVSPEGEIYRVGSFDSSGKWFSADGPGPSMKGICRGYFGYDGGFGVFTKAAVKLYHWPGPDRIPTQYHGNDLLAEVPEMFRSYKLILEDWSTAKTAFHRLSEAECCYFMHKTSYPRTLMRASGPAYMKAIGHKSLYNALAATKQYLQIIVAGYSERDLAYKEACLKKITEDLNGILIGGHPESRSACSDFMQTIRATAYLNNFSRTKTFHVAMGADESIDTIMRQGEAAEQIKCRVIENGGCVNDMADGAWACFYDQGTWGHCEAVMVFDPFNPMHAPSMQQYSDDCADVQYDEHLGGIGFAMFGGLKTVQKFSKGSYNFFDWTMKLKNIWDPSKVTDQTFR